MSTVETETTQLLSVENNQHIKKKLYIKNGDAGYRSPYLSHAKRALYHLSYIPVMLSASQKYNINMKIGFATQKFDLIIFNF